MSLNLSDDDGSQFIDLEFIGPEKNALTGVILSGGLLRKLNMLKSKVNLRKDLRCTTIINIIIIMDLDDLLDDIDIDTLQARQGTASNIPTAAAAKGSANSKAVTTANLPQPNRTTTTAKTTTARLFSGDIRPWIAASANAPKELRDRWTTMIKADTQCEALSKFQPSTAYSDWDIPASTTSKSNRGVNKCLQELIRTSASKCGIDEVKISKILLMVNPVTDSENGMQLQIAFTKQLVRDLRVDLTSDPNYDPKVFKSLANALVISRG